MKQIKQSLACYNIALDRKDCFYSTALEWRAMLYFSNGDFHDALQDFIKITKLEKGESSSVWLKALYYTGKIYFKMKKINDAIMNFE